MRDIKTRDHAEDYAEEVSEESIERSIGYASKLRPKRKRDRVKEAEKNVRRAERAARAAEYTAKVVKKAAEAIGRAMAEIAKALEAAAEEAGAFIAAGGWVVIAVVIVVLLVGMLAASAFGIMFSNEAKDGETMFRAVREINDEYNELIESFKVTVEYDDLEISGSKAAWKDVIAVYAVSTADAFEVATVTPEKKELLRSVFWKMNHADYTTEAYTENQLVETVDDEGNAVLAETEVELTRLCITLAHKDAGQMADELGFSQAQRAQMFELLSPEYDSLWKTVLYNIDSADNALVAVALSQVGDVGGAAYWSWYGYGTHVDWCACFVSWCANECGYIEEGTFPMFSSCRVGIEWFRDRNLWAERVFEPSPGMIIFFDWEQDGVADHVGIVERSENGYIYTVEGNSGDAVRERSYPQGSGEIVGYGMR